MNNSDMPAMPCKRGPSNAEKQQHGFDGLIGNAPDVLMKGLTKREHFAGLAMQGLLADFQVDGTHKEISNVAIKMADALLAELENTK